MRNYKKFITPVFILALTALPQLASAKLPLVKPSTNLPEIADGTPAGMIIWLINTLLVFAGLLAVLFIIIGGFQYILSGANEELAESGKKTLRNAVIGLVIIILSYVIVNVINNALA